MAYTVSGSSTYPHPPQYTADPYQNPPVIIEQPVHVVHVQAAQAVGPNPSMVTCQTCQKNVMTRMEYESTLRTHLMAFLLCAVGLWPCVCAPYCIDSCQSGNHYCPSCGSFIGTYQNNCC